MRLESEGSPIGLADDAYVERSVYLASGDRLYLYSDGVLEAMDPDGKPFGEAQLLAAISERRCELIDYGVATLAESIARWRGSEKQQDDISILAVEFSFAADGDRLGGPSLMAPPVRTLST